MRALIGIGLLVAVSAGSAQETATRPGAAVVTPAFEVTSVRANPVASSPYSMRWLPDGRFQATNITTRRLINLAYDVRTDHQLIGATGWIASDGFDIEAVPAVVVPRSQQKLMLQGLLRDRFGLVMSERQVDVPVYALMRTRPDTPLPRTIRQVNCTVERLDASILDERERRGEPPAGVCGAVHIERGRMVGTGAQISTLIADLRPMVDRRILDRTALTGRYDFELMWSLDPLAGSDIVSANAGIFAAIQELGLKLQPASSLEPGYAIERIRRPTPN